MLPEVRESNELRERVNREMARRGLSRRGLAAQLISRASGASMHKYSEYNLLCAWLEDEPGFIGPVRDRFERQVREWLDSTCCVRPNHVPGPLDLSSVHKQLDALLAGDVRARVRLTDRAEQYFAQKGDHHGSHA